MPSSINSAAMVQNAKKNRQTTSLVNLLLLDWPVVKKPLTRLGEHFGDAFVVGKQSAISVAVDYALTKYDESLCSQQGGKLPDIQRLTVFMDALIDKSSEVLPYKVVDVQSGMSWGPLSSTCYRQWYRDACKAGSGNSCIGCELELELYYAQTDEQKQRLREQVYTVITDAHLQDLLKRRRYL